MCGIKKRCERTELLHDTVKGGIHFLNKENFAPGPWGLVHKHTVDWMAKATNIYFILSEDQEFGGKLAGWF